MLATPFAEPGFRNTLTKSNRWRSRAFVFQQRGLHKKVIYPQVHQNWVDYPTYRADSNGRCTKTNHWRSWRSYGFLMSPRWTLNKCSPETDIFNSSMTSRFGDTIQNTAVAGESSITP